MGAISDEFERELAAWAEQYAADPYGEVIQLCLLALEREQIVSVAFRDDVVEQRIRSLPVGPEVRRLIAAAIRWAWQDEEMHAVYIRGFLLRRGGWILKGRAFAQQLSGWIGGWTSSTQQHYRWTEAPVARLTAAAVTAVGVITAKIPKAVRKELEYVNFRGFCRYNIDAEHTAARAWARLLDVVAALDGALDDIIPNVARMRDDEEAHRRLFELFAEAFDEDDRLRPGHDAASLRAAITEIGPYFLPLEDRAGPSRVGRGGPVFIESCASGAEKVAAFRAFCQRCGLVEKIRAARAAKGEGPLEVAVKTSFMMGYDRRDMTAVIDPELLRALGRLLVEEGCRVRIVESSNIYADFFENRDVVSVAAYFGLESDDYEIVDVDAEAGNARHHYARGMAAETLASAWFEADLRLVFSKMRSHPVDLAALGLICLEGLVPQGDNYIFLDRMAERFTPILMLLEEAPPDFTLLDAFERIPDGMAGIMGGRRARSPRRFYGGEDILAVDAVAARHMRAPVFRVSGLYDAARAWFGDPRETLEVVGEDRPLRRWRSPRHGPLSALLSLAAYPVYQLASQRGALFVPDMDPRAFPCKGSASVGTRAFRRLFQSMLGLPQIRRSPGRKESS